MAESIGIVALISGSGSNLQAIIDAVADGRVPAPLRAVVSNRADAFGLTRARRAGVATRVLSQRGFADRAAYDRALQEVIDEHRPGLVVLAGFMRILGPEIVSHYQGRLLNIHPALLPAFKGLHTHQRALQAGVAEHGASVHFVTAELDAGAVVLQARVAVLPDDDADTLAARVLVQEHRIYPKVVEWFVRGRLRMAGDQAVLDGVPLAAPVRLEDLGPEES